MIIAQCKRNSKLIVKNQNGFMHSVDSITKGLALDINSLHAC